MTNTNIFLDYDGFKVLNEDQKQLHYEKILSDLIQYSDANKVLIKERKQIEDENRKLFDISVNSFPPDKNEEIEKERLIHTEEIKKINEILQKESSRANYLQTQFDNASIRLEKIEKELHNRMNETKTHYDNMIQKIESEKMNLIKQMEAQTQKLQEHEQNLEEVVAENSRLMIEIFNLKKLK